MAGRQPLSARVDNRQEPTTVRLSPGDRSGQIALAAAKYRVPVCTAPVATTAGDAKQELDMPDQVARSHISLWPTVHAVTVQPPKNASRASCHCQQPDQAFEPFAESLG